MPDVIKLLLHTLAGTINKLKGMYTHGVSFDTSFAMAASSSARVAEVFLQKSLGHDACETSVEKDSGGGPYLFGCVATGSTWEVVGVKLRWWWVVEQGRRRGGC
jgi:hypothetical protein